MNKPEHLGKHVADQFSDISVVEHYQNRPAYSDEVIAYLSQSLAMQKMDVLDIGCGTGEVSKPLAALGHRVTAIDPSAPMIATAKAGSSNVRFLQSDIEHFGSEETYDLFVAANSIHWVDWPAAFANLKRMSRPHSKLAIVTGGDLQVPSIQQALMQLVRAYSTTKNFSPYNIVDMLSEQGYIENVQVTSLPVAEYQQTAEQYVGAFHGRNGFSIERMGRQGAGEFDQAIFSLLAKHGMNQQVTGEVNFAVSICELS